MILTFLLACALVLMPHPQAHADVLVQDFTVRVHVSGLVKKPGVYTLPRGSRGVDAIQAAGGISPGASVSELNLASLLEDGQRLEVPRRSSTATPATPAPQRRASRPPRRPAALPARPGEKLSINAASIEQFDSLPGIGRTLAGELVRYRTQKGRFRSLDELKEVPGIGERRFERLAPMLTL